MPTPDDILNLPHGAQWFKADLHIHTPASTDFKHDGKAVTPQDVVDVAIQKGLDIIGITDHNTAEWCDDIRQAAEGSGLVVFPGVEISTPQGHVLALFDSTVCSSHIHDLLIKVGIFRSEFGSQDVVTKVGIEDVFAFISEDGGVAVAAHADGPRGFLETIPTGAERKRVYSARNLWAMEILDTTLREDHQAGARYPPRRMTCLQSSDSHKLDKIANRYTFLKMDERSISGLKMALIDPDIRVRLTEDELPSPEEVILGMWVTGGFLDGQTMRFSDNVNCFIGDTGSGKSISVELIRFGLNQQSIVPKIRGEVESLLEQRLGNQGAVHILLAKGESRYLVQRIWGQSPQLPLVQRIIKNGLEPVNRLDITNFFPIKCFSQSEIIEFAREPDVRLSLTDDLIDCSTELASIREAKVHLKRNATTIIAEQAKAENIRRQLGKQPGLAEDLASIDLILTHSRISQQELWYREQNVLKQATMQVGELSDRLTDTTAQLNLAPPWADDMGTLPNQDLLEKAKMAYQDWQDYVTGMRTEAEVKLRALVESIAALQEDWVARFEKAEAEYRLLLDELDKDGIGLNALSERRRNIQAQITTLNNKGRELQEVILPRIHSLNEDREELLDRLQNNRKSITDKRRKKARDLSSKLNHKVRLKVHAQDNKSLFKEALHEIAPGSYLGRTDLDRLADKCHPVPFVKRLLAKEFEELSEKSGLKSDQLARLWGTIEDRNKLEGLYELQITDVEDIIEVQLQMDNGSYRRLEELSHGQKCMVILMVALAEGNSPLLVDQPEDALHAPSIEDSIVASLRSDRGRRQCIFATRNANILVSADAEQIIALQADAQKGQVAGTGSLDRFDHRQLIIYHVEGGDEAFQRRKTMYTLEPPI